MNMPVYILNKRHSIRAAKTIVIPAEAGISLSSEYKLRHDKEKTPR